MPYWTRAQLQRESTRSRADIDRLVSMGLPCETVGRGRGAEIRFDRSAALAWLVNRALETADDPGGSSPEMARERTRLYREQADGQALKNTVSRGQLLPADEVVAGWQAAVGRSRALLLGVPTGAAAQLVLLAREHEGAAERAEEAIRAHLTRAIDAALAELANTSLDEFDDGDGDAGEEAEGDAVGV
jgi:phage terminase Nu1 subunit (DNA packaging protein)